MARYVDFNPIMTPDDQLGQIPIKEGNYIVTESGIVYVDKENERLVISGEKGETGEAATVAVGTTVTTEPGTPASVVNVGTPNAAIFDFSIPRGADGNSGEGGGVRLYIGTEENPVIMSSLPTGFCGISGFTKSNPNATGSNATLNFTTEYWGTIDRSGTLTYFTTFINMAWRVYSYYISGNSAIGQDSLSLRDIVRTNGSQTIGGVKTFSNPPESASAPVNGNQLTNKSYVDSLSPGGGGVPSVAMTGEAAAIDPNTEYIWGETDALHITLNAPVNGIRNEYMFQFTSGIRATDLTVDGDVLWVGGSPRISAETIYRASIVNGIGSMIGVDISEGSPAQRWLDGVTVGWNLAGSLESTGSNYHKDKIGTPEEVPFFETMWGNPMTTKDMLRMVQDKGFNMIRIPITWSQHLDADFRISENWMDRVQEIVDWCVDLGLKCTINTHHDHSPYGDGKDWLWADPSTLSTVLPHLATVWTQIAERFRDYPTDLLAFEGYNELMTKARTWAAPTAAEYDALNQIAQKFVDAVRATGGNNATRILSINTYGCMLVNLQYFKMPYDSANGCLFAQVHYYDVKTNQEVESDLAVLDTYFKDKGIPLLIGEIGTEYTDDYRLRIMAARNLISRTREHGYRCAWWDHGVWMLLDRFKMSWLVPELADALIEGSQVSPADQDYISDHTYTSISQFEYGALNIDDGSRITRTLGALRFPQPIEVTPGYEYIVSAVYSDQGFKIPYLFWYDSDNTYLGYTKPNPSTSYSLVVTFAPIGAKYLNIYFYNPWRTITESGYASMLSSGELSLRISEVANDTPDMPSQPIGDFDFNAFSSWRSGNYVPVRRDFEDDPAQLSIIMPVECRMATEYRFNVSDDDVGITVRELDIHKNMVFEHAYVKDGSYFPTDKRTHYLMLQLFRVSEPAA